MRIQSVTKTALLFLMTIAASGCGNDAPGQGDPPQVRYTTVTEQRITLTSELPGRVSALVVAEVRPQVDGIILERLFEEGADVEKGQVLYQIDPAMYRSAYNTAKAALTEAEANVTALALLEKRYRNLVKTKAVGQQDLDNAISDHAQARARITRMQAELESAAINLAYTKIKAPVSGRIGASSVTAGALVTANQSAALAVIQQIDKVYVDINQSSTDTIRLRRAMAQGKMTPNGSAGKVRLTLEDGSPYTPVAYDYESGEPAWIEGDLLFSEISVGQSTGSVILRVVFNNPDSLLMPGMYVRATIEEGALDKAVLIPQASVLSNDSGGHFVFLLSKDESGESLFRVERRDIVLERSLGNRWIVKSGLASGDTLIVEGLQKAVPGELVKGVPAQRGAPAVSGKPLDGSPGNATGTASNDTSPDTAPGTSGNSEETPDAPSTGESR